MQANRKTFFHQKELIQFLEGRYIQSVITLNHRNYFPVKIVMLIFPQRIGRLIDCVFGCIETM